MKLLNPFNKSVVTLPILAAKARAAAYSFLFPCGSAAGIATDGQVSLTPYRHFNDTWLWWCLKHTDLAGQQPSFRVPKAGRVFAPLADERLAVWATAADTDLWNDFTSVTVGASYIEFQHGTAFTSKRIYISNLPMYPFDRTQRLVSAWALDSRSSDTPSSTDYILGYATPRDAGDGSGRTAPALPFYALKLTNPSGQAKNKALLTTGNHPDETTGRFAFEGAIAWLLGGSALAEFLLDWFEFYLYPCLNPQGVWAGYFRSCPQDKTLDHNRQWAGSGVLECIDLFKTAMLADTGGTIEVGLDYHSSTDNDTAYGNTFDNSDPLHTIYAAKMALLEAGWDLRNSTVLGTLHRLWRDDYLARLSVTLEQGGANTRTISEYKNSGACSLQALAQMLAEGRWTHGPGVGSRDFNGATDRLDWANILDTAGAALTISAWVYLDTTSALNQYIFCVHKSGDLAVGLTFNSPNGGYLTCTRVGTTSYIWDSPAGALATGAWTQVLMTSNGGLLSGSVLLYVNGVSQAISFTNGSGVEAAQTGKWSIGGRLPDDLRNLNGRIAQVGVWSRVLGSAEIAGLALGQAPSLAAPSGLQFYWKGNTSSLVDEITSLNGLADGTAQVTGVGNGPSIVYGSN